jgi:hypothetical protein
VIPYCFDKSRSEELIFYVGGTKGFWAGTGEIFFFFFFFFGAGLGRIGLAEFLLHD